MSESARRAVLIVDDEELNIDVMSIYLEDEFDVRRALDGESALAQLQQPPYPDAILLDVNMPGIDGYEVCARIKAEPLTAHIPVLFVTALEQDEALTFEVGASDYISKPIVREVLRGRVLMQVELSEARARIASLRQAVSNADSVRDLVERRQQRLQDIAANRGLELRALREGSSGA